MNILNFNLLVLHTGMTHAACRRSCGVSARQWRRYRNGQTKPPGSLISLITFLSGDLSNWDGFTSWRLTDGLIHTPENVSFSPGEIRTIPILYAQINELKRKLEVTETKYGLKTPGNYDKRPAIRSDNVVPFAKPIDVS